MKGKDICKSLRSIRRAIADANDIAYSPAECTYQGECQGTCPRCESELRYIERKLRMRVALGKAAVVAGLTLGATSITPIQAQTQTPPPTTNNQQAQAKPIDTAPTDSTAIIIRGTVKEKQDNEPIIGATVTLKGSKSGPFAATDFNGRFALRVSRGSTLVFSFIGHKDVEITVKNDMDDFNVIMEDDDTILFGEVVISKPDVIYPVDADIYIGK